MQKVAQKISTLSEVVSFPFTGAEYPPAGYPKTLDYFFAATLQQFSFWTEHDDRYDQPLIAEIDGVPHKDSDYLWGAFRRGVERDADFCSPQRQADLSREEMLNKCKGVRRSRQHLLQ